MARSTEEVWQRMPPPLAAAAFPDRIQPEKKWEDIQNFEYLEAGSSKIIQFEHGGLLNMHNVRVLDSSTSEVLYFGACKFTDGEATLEEGWITRYDVENDIAHWEVELVNGM